MIKKLIAPSVLSADFANLQRDCEMLERSSADWIHVDVMDGVFVPNISFGFPVLKSLKKHTTKPLDVHVMIMQPERYINEFKYAGAYNLTVHLEACTHLHRTIQQIKQAGMKAGVAINPHSPVEHLLDIISELDLVCVMSVNPGFGGQKFIPSTISKVKRLRYLIENSSSSALIEVDGGVDSSNCNDLFNAGANVLVAGNAVFSAQNPFLAIDKLRGL